jgi:hypothetical protein
MASLKELLELKKDFKKMKVSSVEIARETGVNRVMQGKIFGGDVLTFNYQIVGGGIAVPAQLNINAYANLGMPIYDTSNVFKGLLGSNNAYGVVQYCQPQHAYLPYTGSKPSYSSLQVYTAAFLGTGHFIDASHDPAYLGPGGSWPVGTYIGAGGSIFTCPCCLNTPPSFNAGDIESKLAIYYGNGTGNLLYEVNVMDLLPQNYMSFLNKAPKTTPSPTTALQPWNLSLVGSEGLINTFWGPLVNVWARDKKLMIEAPLSYEQIRAWDWTTAKIIRGGKYYVASIKFKLPDLMHGALAQLECYEI